MAYLSSLMLKISMTLINLASIWPTFAVKTLAMATQSARHNYTPVTELLLIAGCDFHSSLQQRWAVHLTDDLTHAMRYK